MPPHPVMRILDERRLRAKSVCPGISQETWSSVILAGAVLLFDHVTVPAPSLITTLFGRPSGHIQINATDPALAPVANESVQTHSARPDMRRASGIRRPFAVLAPLTYARGYGRRTPLRPASPRGESGGLRRRAGEVDQRRPVRVRDEVAEHPGQPALAPPFEEGAVGQPRKAVAVDDVEARDRELLAAVEGDFRLVRDQEAALAQLLGEFAGARVVALERRAELEGVLHDGGRLPASEQRPVVAIFDRARGLVDAQRVLLLVGALVKDEGIAADVGGNIGAGPPIPGVIDEKVPLAPDAHHDERGRGRRRREYDRVMARRRLELAAVQEHRVARAGEVEPDPPLQRFARVARRVDRRERTVEEGKARIRRWRAARFGRGPARSGPDGGRAIACRWARRSSLGRHDVSCW